MTEAEHLAEAMHGLFAEPNNGWFAPFTDAIAGLSAAQALWVPAPDLNNIWRLVEHVRFTHTVALRWLSGQRVDRAALGAPDDWPALPARPNEAAWQAACGRAIAANHDVAQFVAGLSAEELAAPVYPGGSMHRWQVVQGLSGHTAYHTGQIILLRRLQGSWEISWPRPAASSPQATSVGAAQSKE